MVGHLRGPQHPDGLRPPREHHSSPTGHAIERREYHAAVGYPWEPYEALVGQEVPDDLVRITRILVDLQLQTARVGWATTEALALAQKPLV